MNSLQSTLLRQRLDKPFQSSDEQHYRAGKLEVVLQPKLVIGH